MDSIKELEERKQKLIDARTRRKLSNQFSDLVSEMEKLGIRITIPIESISYKYFDDTTGKMSIDDINAEIIDINKKLYKKKGS